MDTLAPRYMRNETELAVYDGDERGPGIEPVEVIRTCQWVHIDTGDPVTDPDELARLEREYPPTTGD